MRSIGRLAVATSIILAISACGKKDEAPVAVPSEAAVASDAAAAAATIPVGTFDSFNAAGKKLGTTTINADGTYSSDPVGGLREAGIVKMVDGKTCFDPSGKAPAECYTDSAPGADGSFTATDAKGNVETIRPVAK